jgi:hypothetical protein
MRGVCHHYKAGRLAWYLPFLTCGFSLPLSRNAHLPVPRLGRAQRNRAYDLSCRGRRCVLSTGRDSRKDAAPASIRGGGGARRSRITPRGQARREGASPSRGSGPPGAMSRPRFPCSWTRRLRPPEDPNCCPRPRAVSRRVRGGRPMRRRQSTSATCCFPPTSPPTTNV